MPSAAVARRPAAGRAPTRNRGGWTPWRRARVAVRPVRPRGRPDPRRKTGGPFSFLFGSAAYYVPRRTHPCDHTSYGTLTAGGRGAGGGGAAQTINTDHVNESRRRNPARLWTEDPAPGPLRRRRVNVCSAVHPASHRCRTVNRGTVRRPRCTLFHGLTLRNRCFSMVKEITAPPPRSPDTRVPESAVDPVCSRSTLVPPPKG